MTDLNDSDVLKTLTDAVKVAVADSLEPTLPIKFLGRNWIDPESGKWVELVFIPNNQDLYYGDETLFQGIFRMVLHWPLNDMGVYSPQRVIASIAKHFKKTEPLHGAEISLQIYQKPTTGGMLTTDKDNLFPASLSYRSFQP